MIMLQEMGRILSIAGFVGLLGIMYIVLVKLAVSCPFLDKKK